MLSGDGAEMHDAKCDGNGTAAGCNSAGGEYMSLALHDASTQMHISTAISPSPLATSEMAPETWLFASPVRFSGRSSWLTSWLRSAPAPFDLAASIFNCKQTGRKGED